MNREEVNHRLCGRTWFQASRREVQEKILALKDDCLGFLSHLAGRPDEGGGVRIVCIEEVLIPDSPVYGIFINFVVRSLRDCKVNRYQYFCWKQGSEAGAKGVLLIKDPRAGTITHLVCLRGFSFAAATEVWDGIGGFAELNETGVLAMIQRFKTELHEELGLDPEVPSLEVIELGRLRTDPGMSPNCPSLFAAVVSTADSLRIGDRDHINPDWREMTSGALVIPVAALWGREGFLVGCDCSWVLACVAKLVAMGWLTPVLP